MTPTGVSSVSNYEYLEYVIKSRELLEMCRLTTYFRSGGSVPNPGSGRPPGKLGYALHDSWRRLRPARTSHDNSMTLEKPWDGVFVLIAPKIDLW